MLARCAHATEAGHASAIDTKHRVPAGMDEAMLQRFLNPWSARAPIKGSQQPHSPTLRAARGSCRSPAACGRAACARTHHTAPHSAPNDTRVDNAPSNTTARAAAGPAEAGVARATSAKTCRDQRSCSAAAERFGRARLTLAPSSRAEHIARCTTRHARNALRTIRPRNTQRSPSATHTQRSPSATRAAMRELHSPLRHSVRDRRRRKAPTRESVHRITGPSRVAEVPPTRPSRETRQ